MAKLQRFICIHKLSRYLSKEEIETISNDYRNKKGYRLVFPPSMEFKCELTGKVISQIDKACENYRGDKMMEGIRKDISTACNVLFKGTNLK